MPYLKKHKNSWYIYFIRDGVDYRRSLGKITEEQANGVLEQASSGLLPSTSKPIKPSEYWKIHHKSKHRAAVRGIPHVLTLDQFWAIVRRADGRCEVSGLPFDKEHRPAGVTRRPWFPSLDRIDSNGAYSADNCRLVCLAVNIALCEWGMDTLRTIAMAMVVGKRTNVPTNYAQNDHLVEKSAA